MPHTPGPWSYEFKSIQDDWGEIRAAGRRLVARCAFGYWSDEELNAHRRAKTDPAADNARLIAAAPDMVEALDGLLMALDLPGDHCEVEQATRHAKATLAKALGTNQ